MPRQLPWVNKGNQAKPKPLPKPIRRRRSDDDFFEGTVLQRDEDGIRAPSSSPPPMEEFSPLEVGFMEDGSNKFDLRDDEWRMVEDEFLLTAKLFTQHLHLAEYERIKSAIEEKKSNIDRPTVPNATPSFEARHRMRAEEQSKAQEEALKDIDHRLIGGARASARKPVSISTSIKKASAPPSASRVSESSSSDSDDLDAPRKQPKKNATLHDTPKPTTPKPRLVRTSHPTPVKTNHVEELWGETAATPGRRVLSKEVADRLAKRKAEKEKEKEKEVEKKAKTDVEIPTFLF